MTRPHTMFVQSQVLPWEPGRVAPWQGLETKTLSRDEESGAATMLVRYPPGWQSESSVCLSAGEEIFVLDGDLSLGSQVLGYNGYAWIPPGWDRGSMRSVNGAVVVAMYDGQPLNQAVAHAGLEPVWLPDIPAAGLEGWTENPYTRYLPGTGVWPLKQDEETGEVTILYSSFPYRYMEHRWAHEDVQEMYLLTGEYAINDVGVMRPGAYAWWAPGETHGPYGSRTGFLMLIRSVGGPLSNIIDEETIPVNYSAAYQPRLPAEFAALAREIRTTKCY